MRARQESNEQSCAGLSAGLAVALLDVGDEVGDGGQHKAMRLTVSVGKVGERGGQQESTRNPVLRNCYFAERD